MDNFKELSTIWQSNLPQENGIKVSDLRSSGIIDKLKKLEKKHFRINLIKTIAVGVLTLFLTYNILSLPNVSILTKSALGWIILSLMAGMFFYWRMQYNSSQFNFLDNSLAFIESTIIKLNSQKQIITRLMPVMVISLIIGMNAIYLDLLQEENFTIRISMHLFMTSFLLLAMYLGLKVRKRRFNNDFKPIIDELDLIKQNFKNDE
ncbi:MAG: hypothetical protein CVU00_06795 [Bacteroidetes bacterium HGW-Bacteroidetes-17]|jgi:hypothetical protein|nr:MAG: hypothetical protein CVU00_06795 [Bacteroidetes bacterium HGW-Bacteroidetes-17]